MASVTGTDMAGLYLTRLFLPEEGAQRLLVADLSAENRQWLKAAYGDAALVPVSREDLLAELSRRHGEMLLDDAVFALDRSRPELSARTVMTRPQKIVAMLLATSALASFACFPADSWYITCDGLSTIVLLSAGFRGWLSRPRIAGEASPYRFDAVLPTYTILVPLYREVAVLAQLVANMQALDYPAHLLQVILVLEGDDLETIAAARGAVAGDPRFEIVAVPPGNPRTKPKAANYALAFARGEYLVVYDAEDQPEPDQLKKAVALFRSRSRQVACVQARLAFRNADQNWLTHMFALDYRVWFHWLLPGLDQMGVPMPLGGTSNHFRTSVLRDIGGWDAFNVTEDADIGIRLAQLGYRTAMLDSTTFEEATCSLNAWLKQRSRWMKGYMQTWLVHMRNPLRLYRQAGLLGFVSFQLFIGGTVLFALVNLPLWLLLLAVMLLWCVPGAWHPSLLMPGCECLLTNAILMGLAMHAPAQPGHKHARLYSLTVLAYWALVSIAGGLALRQLISRPHYWEKTTHGVSGS